MSVIEDNWDLLLNLNTIEQNSHKEFEANMKCLHQRILDLLEDGFKVNKCNINENISQNHDDHLQALTERNKRLRLDIDTKLEALSKQQEVYASCKKDQKLLSQEIKETHEAFLMAKKYYKKFLKIYFSVESRAAGKQTIFVQFFTETKKESENYSVRLLRDVKNGSYQLISVTPKLHSFKDLQRMFDGTTDVPGGLNYIRQAFINLKNKK